MVTATSYSSRLRREDCRRTKHDSVSSEWKVLIGPSDWEDCSLGKDGVERYRTHNLPANCPCPGFYELGIAVTSTNEGHNTRQHALKNIIVVYLGQADNVRIRLQQYGRAGSHLDHGKSLSYLKNSEDPCLQSGPGLFKEIFSRGYSIVYRWAPMRDKKEAENMEKKLLDHFDYAWNKLGNGTCRREDIISRLEIELSKSNAGLLSMFYKWKQPLINKKLGVKISSPLEETESLDNRGFLPQILKFMRYQPRSVQLGDNCYQDENICGVAIGNGYICRNKPVLGNKRCSDHKGKRITGISRVTIRDIKMPEDDPSVLNSKLLIPTFHEPESEVIRKSHNFNQKCRYIKMPKDEPSVSADYRLLVPTSYDPDSLFTRKTFNYEYDTCGVVLEDSSVCQNRPVPGRKRCEMHKGQRITKPLSFATNEHCSVKGTERYSLDEECNICGVISGDGSVCRSRPVQGRKRCEFHKGRRITEPKSPTSKKDRPPTRMHKLTFTFDDDICGVTTNSGYVCMRPPVPGRKRCEEHKGMRTTVTCKTSMVSSGVETSSTCGVYLNNGYLHEPICARKEAMCKT